MYIWWAFSLFEYPDGTEAAQDDPSRILYRILSGPPPLQVWPEARGRCCTLQYVHGHILQAPVSAPHGYITTTSTPVPILPVFPCICAALTMTHEGRDTSLPEKGTQAATT